MNMHATLPRGIPPHEQRGLPGPLPADEICLWQGSPSWTALARRALHLRGLAFYFAVLALWRGADVWMAGGSPASALVAASWLVALGACALGLLGTYAWFAARSTTYTITTRRVVMSFGIALPMTLNIPFKAVGSAALKVHPDGTADIPLELAGRHRSSFLVLWPHARPWRLSPVQPMLRAIPDGQAVAELLAATLRDALEAAGEAAGETSAPRVVRAPRPAEAPVEAAGSRSQAA
jgi:hypothetical protein